MVNFLEISLCAKYREVDNCKVINAKHHDNYSILYRQYIREYLIAITLLRQPDTHVLALKDLNLNDFIGFGRCQ